MDEREPVEMTNRQRPNAIDDPLLFDVCLDCGALPEHHAAGATSAHRAKNTRDVLGKWLDIDRKYHGDDYDIVQAAYDALELAIPTIEDYENGTKET